LIFFFGTDFCEGSTREAKVQHEKFGCRHITDYACKRFDYSDRKTYYLLDLARKVKNYPQIQKALAEGKVGWTKAYRICKLAEAEDQKMSPRIDDEGGIDSSEGEEKEDLAPEPAPVGAASG
jgi:hypothetical protein